MKIFLVLAKVKKISVQHTKLGVAQSYTMSLDQRGAGRWIYFLKGRFATEKVEQ